MTTEKALYDSSGWVDMTVTLASLATSSTLLAGREGTVIVNSSDLFLDYMIAGQVTTGTSPTDNKTIELWLYGEFGDTPDYPDVFDGTDSDETVTSDDIKLAALVHAITISTNNISDRNYPFGPFGIAQLFGGLFVPRRWGVFVTHDTGVNLNATGSNHFIRSMGIHGQSV